MNNKIWCLFLIGFVASCSQPTQIDQEILSLLPNFEVSVNQDDAFDGFILLRKTDDPGAQFMINSDGKVIWCQLSDTTEVRVFTPYTSSYLALHTKRDIHEISYDGDTLLNISLSDIGIDKDLHHEIIKDRNNNILSLTREIIPINLSELEGKELDTIKTDGILKISRTGEILWSWKLTDVMDPLSYPDISKYKRDWGHANALSIDEDGHYLISWRDFNQVWKIDNETGEVIWKYGGESITNKLHRFYGQHNIHKNLDGDYMIFDNGYSRIRRSSRVLAFNFSGDSLENTLTINLPDTLFTVKQGSAYQISEDRFLICSTMRKLLVITDREGEILWLAKSDYEFYRASYVESDILD